MVFDEVLRLFLASRKYGQGGARAKAKPSSLKLYEHWIGHFFNFLTERGINDYTKIRKVDITAFLDWMDLPDGKKQPWALATKLKVMRSLRSMFKFVSTDEDCRTDDDKPLRDWTKALGNIQKSPRKEYIPTEEELREFKNGFITTNRWEYRNYVIYCLLLDTGMRVGEACALTLDDTKTEERLLFVRGGKTGNRVVPVTVGTVRLLKGWLKIRERCNTAKESNYLFVGKYDPYIKRRGVEKAFRIVGDRVGNELLTPHTLRHAFCTYYLKNGGSIDKLRHIVGHADFRMLLEYEHLAKVGGDAMMAEIDRVSPLGNLATAS